MDERIRAIACCPKCHARINSARSEALVTCENEACAYHANGFPVIDGLPALIDFDDSLVSREALINSRGGSGIKRVETPSLKDRVIGFVIGENPVAVPNGDVFINALRQRSPSSVVLIVGGGKRGAGTEKLYASPDIFVVGTDVYRSNEVAVIADGHRLPFADASFDGVWIQAVLEHVLEPSRVVAEIHRVLKPGGIVYAETPFMQQVHEGPYDFTRFTRSGHRWLFRNFEELRSGNVGGAGQSLAWSLRYFVRSVTRSNKLSLLLTAPFFWLRYFDKISPQEYSADAAWGVYFIGQRSETAMRPQAIVAYYPGPAR